MLSATQVPAHVASRFSTRIAGTRSAEKTKTDKYKFLCQQLGIDFVLIIFTTSGGMGEQFQRQYWNPHWNKVEEEDTSKADEDRSHRTVGCQKEEGALAGQIHSRGCKLPVHCRSRPGRCQEWH